MIGSFNRKNWHPTLIIFCFIGIFQIRDIPNCDRQTNKQTDRQTDRQHKYIYMIYVYIYIYITYQADMPFKFFLIIEKEKYSIHYISGLFAQYT